MEELYRFWGTILSFISGLKRYSLPLSVLSSVLFILYVFWKVPAKSIFIADNQTKIEQAQAFVDSGFRSQYSKCLLLKDLGGCRFAHGGNGKDSEAILGVFPVAFSVFAAIFGLLGTYSPLVYISVAFFLLGILSIAYRIGKSPWIPFLLTFGPCFFHSLLFPDYSIVFFCITVFTAYYYRPLGIPGSLFTGFLGGSVIFFRPETIFLPFALGILFVYSVARNGIPKKGTEDASRFLMLVASGLAVCLFLVLNWILYEDLLGTRIAANTDAIDGITPDDKYSSLLLYGNGRVGFLLFSPWVALGVSYLLFRIKDLEKKEKEILIASLLSFVAIVLLAPNDSNIDWGTRYLSWLTIPFIVLFCYGNSNGVLRQTGKPMRAAAGILLTLSFFFAYTFFKLQIKVTKEFLKYNSFLIARPGEVALLVEPTIAGYYGPEILQKKVLIVPKDQTEFISFLSGKVVSLDLVRFEPKTLSFVEAISGKNSSKTEKSLEEELKKQGWKAVSAEILDQIETIHFEKPN